VGGFAGAKTTLDGHFIDGIYQDDTWSDSDTGKTAAFGSCFDRPNVTPAGFLVAYNPSEVLDEQRSAKSSH
jgi:hypothetical protein